MTAPADKLREMIREATATFKRLKREGSPEWVVAYYEGRVAALREALKVVEGKDG